MNYSTAVFLINQKVRAVAVNYEPGEKKVTVFKTLDETIVKDDYVVVPTDTRHKFTVSRVVEADVDVDFDSSEQMAWVVARVDRAAYDRTLRQEEDAVRVVKSAEIRKKREDLAAAMLKDHMTAVRSLELADVADDKPAT